MYSEKRRVILINFIHVRAVHATATFERMKAVMKTVRKTVGPQMIIFIHTEKHAHVMHTRAELKVNDGMCFKYRNLLF